MQLSFVNILTLVAAICFISQVKQQLFFRPKMEKEKMGEEKR
jgi:hypothetical protein